MSGYATEFAGNNFGNETILHAVQFFLLQPLTLAESFCACFNAQGKF